MEVRLPIMRKKYCLIANILLLFWFFLDMTGVYFGDKYLVAASFKDDWIFMLIYLAVLIIFILKEKIGKYTLIGWLSVWFISQFLSHEWYTIFGKGFMGTIENKIKYFENSLKLIESSTIYYPDAYHIILHILILVSLVMTIKYCVKKRAIKKAN